jgi:hypothetical protein
MAGARDCLRIATDVQPFAVDANNDREQRFERSEILVVPSVEVQMIEIGDLKDPLGRGAARDVFHYPLERLSAPGSCAFPQSKRRPEDLGRNDRLEQTLRALKEP